jgi:sortase A
MLKKLFQFISSVFIFSLIVFSFWKFVLPNPYDLKPNKITEIISPTLYFDHDTLIAQPKTLIIPKIHVISEIENVGLDSFQRMDVPKKPENVGWYQYGKKPGSKGNAVIDGHLDSQTGPAVFYQLSSLIPGDTIKVIDKNNKEYNFKVTALETYNLEEFPINKVFSPNTDNRNLNLITCAGQFNNEIKIYSKRIVVYSELI